MTDYSGSGTEETDTTVDLVIRNDLSDPLIENQAYSTNEQGGVAFKLDEDTETVRFDVNNDSTTLVDDAGINLAAGRNYTLILIGQLAGSGDQVPRLKRFVQSAQAIASNQVRVRLIHALSDASGETVSVDVEGDNVVSSLGYGMATGYVTGVPAVAGQLEMEITLSAGGSSTKTCTVEGGKSYDAIITHPSYDSAAVAVFCQQVARS
ncbi:MAG: DUF4397 domain-containing protein [Pseudomonadota bacterium]|nr:DUF4397 domain-containing protein [Pseudomonadota bacterium]